MTPEWPYCYQILPLLIHENLKGESTSLPRVTCGAALFQATLQFISLRTAHAEICLRFTG